MLWSACMFGDLCNTARIEELVTVGLYNIQRSEMFCEQGSFSTEFTFDQFRRFLPIIKNIINDLIERRLLKNGTKIEGSVGHMCHQRSFRTSNRFFLRAFLACENS